MIHKPQVRREKDPGEQIHLVLKTRGYSTQLSRKAFILKRVKIASGMSCESVL